MAKLSAVIEIGNTQFNWAILKWLGKCPSGFGKNSTLILGTPKNKFNFAEIRAKYKITKSSRFKIGYEALYLDRVAGVSDNVPVVLTATTGSDTSDSGQMFFHGISIGFEIFR